MTELKPEIGKTYSTDCGNLFTVVQQLENPLTYLTQSVHTHGVEGYYQLVYDDLSFWVDDGERETLIEEITLPQFNFWNAIKPSIDSLFVAISQELKIKIIRIHNTSGQEVTIMMDRLFGIDNLISNPREGYWTFHRPMEPQCVTVKRND